MIDMFFRLVVVGGLMISTAYLPLLGAGAAEPPPRITNQVKAFWTCPPQRSMLVQACVA